MYVCPSACESACVNDNGIHFSVHPGDLSEFVLLKQKKGEALIYVYLFYEYVML